MSHPIYAYVENCGGYRNDGDRFVEDDSLVHRYVKTFDGKATFETWMDCMCGPDGHMSVIKWWWDRPPCDELAAIKKEFPPTPSLAGA
jgi:hypothetical protein